MGKPLYFAVCGNPGPWDPLNPLKVVHEDNPTIALDLISILGRGVENKQIINETLNFNQNKFEKLLYDLKNCGLIKELEESSSENRIVPTFPIFTEELWETFEEHIETVSLEIAKKWNQSLFQSLTNASKEHHYLKSLKNR